MDTNVLIKAIRRVKAEKNILLLAHYYQLPEIQDLADYVGDSLGLSQYAASMNARTIAFAGVQFMAETAKILNPQAKVLIPDMEAGCSLADSCPPDEFKKFLQSYPDHTVVTYVNCSAAVKAMSDVICTSSNAEQIINSIPRGKGIVFAPDKNLGKYLTWKTKRELVLWDGACVVHESFAIDKLLALSAKFPDAKIVAHPESEMHVLKVAQYIGSTTGIIDFIKKSKAKTFIVATEVGIVHGIRKEVEDKIIIPAPVNENNTCACSECAYMKKNTLEKLYLCLLNEYPVVEIDEPLRQKALKPMKRMLELCKSGYALS